MASPDLWVQRGQEGIAIFSRDEKYRYALTRIWDHERPECVFIMLNPSTADAFYLDPTVQRCYNRARKLHAGGMVIYNLFAFRSTDPQQLQVCEDPVGPLNDHVIEHGLLSTNIGWVIAAWGNDGYYLDRGHETERMLGSMPELPTFCLGRTKLGYPKHPLYLANGESLEPLI